MGRFGLCVLAALAAAFLAARLGEAASVTFYQDIDLSGPNQSWQFDAPNAGKCSSCKNMVMLQVARAL
jgi:hypothetical protein